MSILVEPRTRSILFAIGALTLLAIVAWALLTRESAPVPDTAGNPASTSEVIPYAPPVPNESLPTITPSASATPAPSPDTSTVLPKWTDRDVTRYLKARNTSNWQDSQQSRIDTLVAAGGVPGSRAGGSGYSEDAARQCIMQYCAREFLSVEDIRPGEPGQITAKVNVKFTDFGDSVTQQVTCTLTLATGPDTKRGMFTDAACLGSGG